jgi:hypothetical protein
MPSKPSSRPSMDFTDDSSLNIPLCSIACNRLILSLRGIYLKKDFSIDATTTTSYEIDRAHDGSDNTRNIPLDSIRTYSPKREADDWDLDSESRSHYKLSRLSRERSLMEPQTSRSSDPTRPVASPLVARVTVTKTKVVVGGDGKQYEIPVEPIEKRVRGQDKSKVMDWWDPWDSVGEDPKADQDEVSKPRVYETRVGYHNDHISEEDYC